MKMNIRSRLLTPWIVLFTVIIISIIIAGSRYHFDLRLSKYFLEILVLLSLFCSYLNFKTITKAGIWISYSVPKNYKLNSSHWLVRVFFILLGAFAFYKIGKISWVPLYWQGFVLPIIFSVAVISVIFNIISPILIWCANLNFARLAAVLGTCPILILLPISGIFIGNMILGAYEASIPKPFSLEYKRTSFVNEQISSASKFFQDKNKQNTKVKNNLVVVGSEDKALAEVDLEDPQSEKAKKFKELVLKKTSCSEEASSVQRALHERNPDEVVYWATKAVRCANLRPIPALTKLVDIMLKHSNTKVRASAIMAMGLFNAERVKNISYLIVKQISEKQAPAVIEAASDVFSKLGSTEYNWTMRRLKVLLSHPNLHLDIAKIMVRVMNHEDLILEHIITNLDKSKERTPSKMAAVEMICALPKKSLSTLEPHINSIIGLIDTGDNHDQAKQALDCLGTSGINAIREEIKIPKALTRVTAARVLSHMDIKNSKEVLETLSLCIHDVDEEIRKICSISLGKVGAVALPKIIDLMNASKDEDKRYGERALGSLEDPAAKQYLLKIRARNSGWLATQKKLHLVRSIDTTLGRIQDLQRQLLKSKYNINGSESLPVKASVTDETKNKKTL